ncbi:MAG: hypothetical protein ABSH28_19985 [Acidobacteriota bacterium]|jgi:hypothetical protein
MHWRNPAFLWFEIVPGVALVGWVVSEWLRHHRLKSFGDPMVLGIAIPWVPRTAALLVLLLGLASAAAVIPLPASNLEEAPAKTPEILIMLDVPPTESAEDPIWDALEGAVQALLDQGTGARFGVLASGWPPEVLVYPTVDAKGLQIIVSRQRFVMQRTTRLGLPETLSRYVGQKPAGSSNSRLVVVTALPPEEIERLSSTRQGGLPDILFVRLGRGSAAAQYGYQSATGAWTWSSHSSKIRDIMKISLTGSSLIGRVTPIQWFALLALFFLCLEYVCSMIARPGSGKGFIG